MSVMSGKVRRSSGFGEGSDESECIRRAQAGNVIDAGAVEYQDVLVCRRKVMAGVTSYKAKENAINNLVYRLVAIVDQSTKAV